MDEQSVARIIEVLETDPDFFVPVRRLWSILQEEGLALNTPLQSLADELSVDERFEFIPEMLIGEEGWQPLQEMEEQDSSESREGPRVKLVSREMTAEDIMIAMARSLTQMNDAIRHAWDARPAGDLETESQMLEILSAGQQMEQEIQDLIEKHQQEAGSSSAQGERHEKDQVV